MGHNRAGVIRKKRLKRAKKIADLRAAKQASAETGTAKSAR